MLKEQIFHGCTKGGRHDPSCRTKQKHKVNCNVTGKSNLYLILCAGAAIYIGYTF